MVESEEEEFENSWFSTVTNYSTQEINNAIEYLSDLGAVELIRTFGTAPYSFNTVFLQSRGRYLYHEIEEKNQNLQTNETSLPQRPFNPIGSPYGFKEYDWETVSLHKEDKNKLYVVIGFQFESKFYDTDMLLKNVKNHFQKAVSEYNKRNNSNITLIFEKLGAGYGEHLFNEIARNIIGSDIAVFETSDLNPNVMIELGVALTWGVRVLPLRESTCPKPPSDISGQTWIEHQKSTEKIIDADFEKRLLKMIERTIAQKGR